MIDAAVFQQLRPYLFSIAYRMLGSASDAEDIVQDAYLRAAGHEGEEIRSARAFLGTVVTRLCLDRLKSARQAREQYVGPWLPEPLLTSDGSEVERPVQQLEWVTLAFLTLLESLSPQERAVFLLREVFEYDHAEIAEAVGVSPANSRQIYHRAKERLGAALPRHRAPVDHDRDVVRRFMAALEAGDAAGAAGLLADDITFKADGGGKAVAARTVLEGRERVAPFLKVLARGAVALRYTGTIRVQFTEVNAEAAALVWLDSRLETVFVFTVRDERIERIHALRNPDKLRRIAREAGRLPGAPARAVMTT